MSAYGWYTTPAVTPNPNPSSAFGWYQGPRQKAEASKKRKADWKPPGTPGYSSWTGEKDPDPGPGRLAKSFRPTEGSMYMRPGTGADFAESSGIAPAPVFIFGDDTLPNLNYEPFGKNVWKQIDILKRIEPLGEKKRLDDQGPEIEAALDERDEKQAEFFSEQFGQPPNKKLIEDTVPINPAVDFNAAYAPLDIT